MTRALIEVRTKDREPLHVTGWWLNTQSTYADFGVGNTQALLLAVRIKDETSIPDAVSVSGREQLQMWNVSEATKADIRVKLVGGLDRLRVREFEFSMLIRPVLRIV